jgi:hypothetical protein
LRRALCLALAAAALLAGTARADGDPASDVLFSQQVFLPYSAPVSSPEVQELVNTVAAANRAGVKVRVAVIATKIDLGAVPGLFGKPERYARFLGGEISFGWKGLVLIAMPSGLAVSRSFHPAPRENAIVSKVKPEATDANGLAAAGAEAVRRLAAADGKKLVVAAPQTAKSGGGSRTRDRIVIAVAAVVGAALVGAIVLLARRRRSRSG